MKALFISKAEAEALVKVVKFSLSDWDKERHILVKFLEEQLQQAEDKVVLTSAFIIYYTYYLEGKEPIKSSEKEKYEKQLNYLKKVGAFERLNVWYRENYEESMRVLEARY